MKSNHTKEAAAQKLQLLSLCRFLSLRVFHTVFVILLFSCGMILSLINCHTFAPYGIAAVYLLLPSFIGNSFSSNTKKENNDTPLCILCSKYHYSPISLFSYRTSHFLCSLLLFCWHITQGKYYFTNRFSLPLLLFLLNLSGHIIVSRILYRHFHHKLMLGEL